MAIIRFFQYSYTGNIDHTLMYYWCDTLTELESINCTEGSMGYVKSTHRLYFWAGTEWRQIRY